MKDLVFVAMPFDSEMWSVWETIKSAVEEVGAKPIRVDQLPRIEENLHDVIFRTIEESDVLIGDLTTANPNVSMEVQHARNFKKPVILIVQNPDDLPFDLRVQRAIVYKNTSEELKILEKRLVDSVKANLDYVHANSPTTPYEKEMYENFLRLEKDGELRKFIREQHGEWDDQIFEKWTEKLALKNYYPIDEDELQKALLNEKNIYEDQKKNVEKHIKMAISYSKSFRYKDAINILKNIKEIGFWNEELSSLEEDFQKKYQKFQNKKNMGVQLWQEKNTSAYEYLLQAKNLNPLDQTVKDLLREVDSVLNNQYPDKLFNLALNLVKKITSSTLNDICLNLIQVGQKEKCLGFLKQAPLSVYDSALACTMIEVKEIELAKNFLSKTETNDDFCEAVLLVANRMKECNQNHEAKKLLLETLCKIEKNQKSFFWLANFAVAFSELKEEQLSEQTFDNAIDSITPNDTTYLNNKNDTDMQYIAEKLGQIGKVERASKILSTIYNTLNEGYDLGNNKLYRLSLAAAKSGCFNLATQFMANREAKLRSIEKSEIFVEMAKSVKNHKKKIEMINQAYEHAKKAVDDYKSFPFVGKDERINPVLKSICMLYVEVEYGDRSLEICSNDIDCEEQSEILYHLGKYYLKLKKLDIVLSLLQKISGEQYQLDLLVDVLSFSLKSPLEIETIYIKFKGMIKKISCLRLPNDYQDLFPYQKSNLPKKLSEMAKSLRFLNKYEKSLEVFQFTEEVITILVDSTNVSPYNQYIYMQTLSKLALELKLSGEEEKANKTFQKVLGIIEKDYFELGQGHLKIRDGQTISYVALTLACCGQRDKAYQLFQRALELGVRDENEIVKNLINTYCFLVKNKS